MKKDTQSNMRDNFRGKKIYKKIVFIKNIIKNENWIKITIYNMPWFLYMYLYICEKLKNNGALERVCLFVYDYVFVYRKTYWMVTLKK